MQPITTSSVKPFSSSRTLLTQKPIAQGMVSSQSPVVFTVLPSLCDPPAEWLPILWITDNISAGNLHPVHIITNYQMISGARCVNLLELSHGSRRGTLNKRNLGFHRVEATSPRSMAGGLVHSEGKAFRIFLSFFTVVVERVVVPTTPNTRI